MTNVFEILARRQSQTQKVIDKTSEMKNYVLDTDADEFVYKSVSFPSKYGHPKERRIFLMDFFHP